MKASLMLRLERSTIARHIRRLASSADYLERIIRPYMYENMMWYTLPIVDALGSAVIERSASTALTKEKELTAQSRIILDTYRVALLYSRSDYEDAIRLGEEVLSGLPKGTILLKARTEAIMADSLRRTGNSEAAFAKYGSVMDRFPTVLRMMNLALPVRLDIKVSKLKRSQSLCWRVHALRKIKHLRLHFS